MATNKIYGAAYTPRLILFNRFAPGANTGIIDTVSDLEALTFSAPVTVTLTIALAISSIVNVTCSNGVITHKWGLNESNALNLRDLYKFDIDVYDVDQSGNTLTYDFEVETDGVIEYLTVIERQDR